MAALGQLASFAVYAVGDTGGLPASTFLRIGWFYFGFFHHVPLAAKASVSDLGPIAGVVQNSPAGASITYAVGLALLLVTALGVWLLFRAGRLVADRAGGGALARVLHGMKVAPVYAIPAFVFSLLVGLRVSFGTVVTGAVELRLSAPMSFVMPLLIAAVAGAAGGLRSALRNVGSVRIARVSAILSGGWRMLLVGLGLSYLGLFVAGAVQPDEPVAFLTPSTAKYYQTIFERPDVGAVVLAHHLALAPNEALWVLVPAMGSCDGVYGDVSYAFLCYWKYPTSVSLPATASGPLQQQPAPTVVLGRVPAPYFLFLLAPALAVLLGGRRAASRGAPRSAVEAAALGAGAGAVFAVLVVGVGYLSAISVGASGGLLGLPSGGRVIIGPDLIGGGVVALAWGVAGGALGGLLEARAGR
jgi:hypothetical protein